MLEEFLIGILLLVFLLYVLYLALNLPGDMILIPAKIDM